MCIIKEPWDTPQRATPKSCYPCKKSENFWNKSQKFKKYHGTTEKTSHEFQTIKKRGKNRTNSTNKNKQKKEHMKKLNEKIGKKQ